MENFTFDALLLAFFALRRTGNISGVHLPQKEEKKNVP
jgi:hypothetical protein